MYIYVLILLWYKTTTKNKINEQTTSITATMEGFCSCKAKQTNKQTTTITTPKQGLCSCLLRWSGLFLPVRYLCLAGRTWSPRVLTRQPLKTTTTAAAVSRRGLLQMRDDRRAGYGRGLTKCWQVLTISSPCVDTNSKGLPKARLIRSLCGVLAESAQLYGPRRPSYSD